MARVNQKLNATVVSTSAVTLLNSKGIEELQRALQNQANSVKTNHLNNENPANFNK